jgi:hypothetical protein
MTRLGGFVDRRITTLSVFLFLIISLQGCVTSDNLNQTPETATSCPQDKVLNDILKRAKSGKSSIGDSQYAYANLAETLIQRMHGNARYCGFTEKNVLFLLRQATANDDGTQFDTSAQLASGAIKESLSQGFAQGTLGLPLDRQLAECWFKVGSAELRKCEALEQQKLCKVSPGEAPLGFRSLRNDLKDSDC